MFITFKTRSQAKNYIKRTRHANYSYHEGCGCCYSSNSMFLDGNKLVLSYFNSHEGYVTTSATVIGKILGRQELNPKIGID